MGIIPHAAKADRIGVNQRTWTPERVELLAALWADGIAAGVIAKRMGMTRGMVAGKRHSLGLPPRELEAQKVAMAANGRRTALLCGHVGKAPPEVDREKAAAVAATLEGLSRPLDGSNPLPWELRRGGECAWPVDGPAMFGVPTWSCCEAAEPGRPYCFAHLEVLAGRPWPPAEGPPGPDPSPGASGLPPVDAAAEACALV